MAIKMGILEFIWAGIWAAATLMLSLVNIFPKWGEVPTKVPVPNEQSKSAHQVFGAPAVPRFRRNCLRSMTRS